ncbi:hypothetical protein UAS_02174 [Enterococcus asini ATCC 700915]|uniref:Restriction endonuclease EcoRV n=1 Tax=Enterococcus asini ATCC 700915 TaxID=1158606 RepID=R2PL54_9ENTE|nr:type II restriction endonuclease [Enterococcus asini]EOH85272.1 hypothetical protein UAS_02174 [Enterococcus asini ATCC 700915]EOT57362.1 hypothetical protein I579_00912 [Enterococcus asini ATCC 700915]OJG10152.1 hypothetical protein RU94_GL000705 [Enterococcus asini]
MCDDIFIKTIIEKLPKIDDKNAWDLLGFVNEKKEVFPFGNDSKIIGRLFEVIVYPYLLEVAEELGYKLFESKKQTVYPDFYFLKPDKKRIALDIKTTYRQFDKQGQIKEFNFTAGSFTSYLRNGTKNIDGNYSDYDKHYILGFLYSRNEGESIRKVNLESEDISSIVPAYKDVEYFVQEKYKVAGTSKGSGNTDNIGTFKSKIIKDFQDGNGPFSKLGNDLFHIYWENFPKYKDSQEVKDKLFNNLETFTEWGKETKQLSTEQLTRLEKYLSVETNKECE